MKFSITHPLPPLKCFYKGSLITGSSGNADQYSGKTIALQVRYHFRRKTPLAAIAAFVLHNNFAAPTRTSSRTTAIRANRANSHGVCRSGERVEEQLCIPSNPSSSSYSFSCSGLNWFKNSTVATFNLCMAGAFFASLFGYVLLYLFRRDHALKRKPTKTLVEQEILGKPAAGGEREPASDFGIDVIIVGVGVAGSALAYALGEDGRRVHVIERDLTEPDRIVGELLQPGGYLKLIELGLQDKTEISVLQLGSVEKDLWLQNLTRLLRILDCVEEIDSQRVYGYALFKDGKSTRLSYPLEKYHSDVAGRSFHNGRFIQRLRMKACALPYVRLKQGTVTSLLEENGVVKGVHYKTKAGHKHTVLAPLTIVCDGCFSTLHRSLCNPQVDVPSSFVGLILENCKLPFPNHGHVILADPSPILFYPISSTEIRCLVDIPGQRLPSISGGKMANYLKATVAPQIPPELQDAFISAIDKGNIRTMPNRSMPANPHPTPGALVMGDAFNMRHPLTGGGITVVLSDIVVLRDLLKPLPSLNDPTTLCKYLESFYTLRKPVASTINTLAGALYMVFSASPDPARQEMRRACFDYLSLGGIFSSGPVALLSGLNPSPLSLVLHFFAVAMYGVGRLLWPLPSPERVWMAARLISTASGIIFPVIKSEGVRQMFFPVTLSAYYKAPLLKWDACQDSAGS